MGTDWETLIVGVLAFLIAMSWISHFDVRNNNMFGSFDINIQCDEQEEWIAEYNEYLQSQEEDDTIELSELDFGDDVLVLEPIEEDE